MCMLFSYSKVVKISVKARQGVLWRNCKQHKNKESFFRICHSYFMFILLSARLVYLMVIKADHYAKKAKEVQQRERAIKAERGKIYDRNGILIAANKPVSTISVIHNQIKDKETVIRNLSVLLDIDEEKGAKTCRKEIITRKNKIECRKKYLRPDQKTKYGRRDGR